MGTPRIRCGLGPTVQALGRHRRSGRGSCHRGRLLCLSLGRPRHRSLGAFRRALSRIAHFCGNRSFGLAGVHLPLGYPCDRGGRRLRPGGPVVGPVLAPSLPALRLRCRSSLSRSGGASLRDTQSRVRSSCGSSRSRSASRSSPGSSRPGDRWPDDDLRQLDGPRGRAGAGGRAVTVDCPGCPRP